MIWMNLCRENIHNLLFHRIYSIQYNFTQYNMHTQYNDIFMATVELSIVGVRSFKGSTGAVRSYSSLEVIEWAL